MSLILVIFLSGILQSCGAAAVGGVGGSSGGSGALFDGGPVDIPVTIAKLESPDPSHITVSVGTEKNVTLTGQAGAIPNPSVTPFVYVINSATGTATIAPVNADGSFAGLDVGATGPFAVASSVDDVASQISGPVVLKIDDDTYLWLLTNGDTISSGAVAMVGDTVYLVANNASASENVLPSLFKKASTTSSTVYSLGIGGTYGEVGTCDCQIVELAVANETTIARDADGIFYQLDDSTFEPIFTLDAGETYRFMNIYNGEMEDGMNLYMSVATDKNLYMLNLTEETYDLVYALADNETVLADNWVSHSGDLDTGESIGRTLYYDVYFQTETATGLSLSLYILNSLDPSDLNPDWSQAWDPDTTFGGTFGSSRGHSSLTGDEDAPLGDVWYDSFAVQEGEVIDTDDDRHDMIVAQYEKPSNSAVTLDSFTASSLPTCGTLTLGEPLVFHEINSSFNDYGYWINGAITVRPCRQSGDTATYTASTALSDFAAFEITEATQTKTVYNIQPHPTLAFYCALDENSVGQLYAFFTTDEDILAVTEGVEHCNADTNWRVDPDTHHVVFMNASSSLDATQVDFIDPSTDPRFE